MKAPQHRNSLGYVITQGGVSAWTGQPQIVWGLKPDGARVFIDEARRGAADHLKCECGAELIARQGEVRAHHFAHVSGAARSCEEAHLHALGKFAADALKKFGKFRIPRLPGKPEFPYKPETSTFEDAEPEVFDTYGGVRISRSTGDERRELCILFAAKRSKVPPPKEKFMELDVSAMVVDLSGFRNLSDDQLAEAVAFEASRTWLHNAKHPQAEGSQVNEVVHKIRLSHVTDERDWTNPSPVEQHRIPERLTAGRSRAESASNRTKPYSSISEEEWNTLSYTELRRRALGPKY